MTTRSVRAKAAIGYVPQDLAIYPDLTARENLRFFGRLYGMGGRGLARRIDEVLDVVGLADRAKDRTEQYSGGMKRRLNIGDRPAPQAPPPGPRRADRRASTRRAATRSSTSVEALSADGHGASSTRRTTWRRPSACATGSGSSTRAGSSPRARAASWSSWSASRDRVSLSRGRRPGTRGRHRCSPGSTASSRATAREGGIDVLVDDARRILPRLLEAVTR